MFLGSALFFYIHNITIEDNKTNNKWGRGRNNYGGRRCVQLINTSASLCRGAGFNSDLPVWSMFSPVPA